MPDANDFWAHTPQKQGGDPQCLRDHARDTAEAAARFADAFGAADWALAAGLLHDLGKADPRFQEYLRENAAADSDADGEDGEDGGNGAKRRRGTSGVNHSSAGGAFAVERYGKGIGKLLAYLVMGHHAGLPDARGGSAALRERLQNDAAGNLARIRAIIATVPGALNVDALPSLERMQRNIPAAGKAKDGWPLCLRMMYSCLVDADFLNTEAFCNPDRAALRGDGAEEYATLAALRDRFNRHMAEKAVANDDAGRAAPVNTARAEVLAACREAALRPPGVFSLTAPTGGGKTLSSLAFAFDHAARHGKRRIVYVIPYTSIIEQTAGVLAGILGRENVLEHHSNIDPERETERSRLAAENWDAPVIVTTNVQFFESLYAAKSSHCRKLHNIVNSVVILDESQLIPPEWRTPCVDVLRRLAENYGATVLLCTATQPPFPELGPVEIVTDPPSLFRRLRRTELIWPEALDRRTEWPEVARWLSGDRQALCVVNRRKDALALYNLLPKGSFHLSTRMCAAHRKEVLDEIRRRLKAGEVVRVASTQLVEAGVDIDFPFVYRALAGLDSLAQAAGRCNREGWLADPAPVRIFIPRTNLRQDCFAKARMRRFHFGWTTRGGSGSGQEHYILSTFSRMAQSALASNLLFLIPPFIGQSRNRLSAIRRIVAIFSAPCPLRVRFRSSSQTISKTQCKLFSITLVQNKNLNYRSE